MSDSNEKDRCPDFAAMARDGMMPPSAIEQIIECFGKRLERFATYRCQNADLGEDALQDAMIGLIRNLDAYRGDAPIEPWLKKLVVGACGRMRRGKKNAPESNLPLDDSIIENREHETRNAEALLEIKGELERIGEALKSLPELNRNLIYQREGEGHSIKELSARFDLTEEAIKSRLKRARVQLRQELGIGQADNKGKTPHG
jgi:RNA polymerase sigma-70 factor, ECF subfamily